MSILVVGTLAYDDIKTPFGSREGIAGGSGRYFALASSYFAPTYLVAVIGSDFAERDLEPLRARGIDLEGVERAEGKTFRWAGRYESDLNSAVTLNTELNVLADFNPEISANGRKSDYLFLANIDPRIQLSVIERFDRSSRPFIALDTMNYWIETARAETIAAIGMVDLLIINEGEARMLAQEANIIKAARILKGFGPPHLIIKRGEYGALLFSEDAIFNAPAYPLEDVIDPTGAGDTFAGGALGHIASVDASSIDSELLRQAILVGSTMASLVVERFGSSRLLDLDRLEINDRLRAFGRMSRFEEFLPI